MGAISFCTMYLIMNCEMCCTQLCGNVVYEVERSRNIPSKSEYCLLIVMQKSVQKDCDDVNAFVDHYWEGNISFILLQCFLSSHCTLLWPFVSTLLLSAMCLDFLHVHMCTHTHTHVWSKRERERERAKSKLMTCWFYWLGTHYSDPS